MIIMKGNLRIEGSTEKGKKCFRKRWNELFKL